jgi:hypothetical protein
VRLFSRRIHFRGPSSLQSLLEALTTFGRALPNGVPQPPQFWAGRFGTKALSGGYYCRPFSVKKVWRPIFGVGCELTGENLCENKDCK